jgi:kynurenine aminotransferase
VSSSTPLKHVPDDKTVVNTPHNPCGKVFTQTELEQIADIAKEFDLMVLADEVVRTSTYEDKIMR